MKNLWMAGAAAALLCGVSWAGMVNVNSADAKTLAKELVGVGPAKAEAIVKYRAEKGAFKSPEELKKVEGVGEATYEQNKASIKVKD